MKKFSVTVKTELGTEHYTAIASTSLDVVLAAFDRYGVCSVRVVPV